MSQIKTPAVLWVGATAVEHAHTIATLTRSGIRVHRAATIGDAIAFADRTAMSVAATDLADGYGIEIMRSVRVRHHAIPGVVFDDEPMTRRVHGWIRRERVSLITTHQGLADRLAMHCGQAQDVLSHREIRGRGPERKTLVRRLFAGLRLITGADRRGSQ